MSELIEAATGFSSSAAQRIRIYLKSPGDVNNRISISLLGVVEVQIKNWVLVGAN